MALAPPTPAEGGVIFDLAAVDGQAREEEVYVRGGHTARTLVREPDLRVVLLVMKAGSRVEEHRAQGTASVQVVSGQVRMQLPDKSVELAPGKVLILDRGLPHDVEALSDSSVLLTLAWQSD